MQPTQSTSNGAILVATKGSPQCGDTLEWAAAEADARGCMLRIVHVVDWPRMTADIFGAPPVDRLAEATSAGEAILDEATRRARTVAPNVRVVSQLELDLSPGVGIVRAAGNDSLIVLGRRGGRQHFRRFTHSTAAHVARHALCPVAVIGLLGETKSPAAGRVTAVLDCQMGSLRALDFAIRAAERRGADVTVLRVGDPGSDRFERALNELVRTTPQPGSPTLLVQERALATAPRLVAHSAGAALVVLSDETPRSIHRALFGRNGRSAQRSALGPVVLVRKDS